MTAAATFLTSEAGMRLAVAAGIFACLALSEALLPARRRNFPRATRWPANIALTLLNTLMLRLFFPLLAVGVAVWAAEHRFGLFYRAGFDGVAAFAVTLIVLDVVIYGQHVAMHRIGVLWRLHRVHHTDRDVDVTTALRFHPGEIALSMGLKMAIVALLGAPPLAVLTFEAILNGMATFNHANLRLPTATDRVLRALVVTPDMHRIHHSERHDEMDSNYGFNLSAWDRLFGTYRKRASVAGFALGLEAFKGPSVTGLGFALILPFKKGPAR